jgi:hypothetical protein
MRSPTEIRQGADGKGGVVRRGRFNWNDSIVGLPEGACQLSGCLPVAEAIARSAAALADCL